MTPIISTTILRTQSDDRLVALARDGHERAFEALVERYRKPLLRHVRRILPEARAEDAVQQAFLNAWSALERGSEVREPRAWGDRNEIHPVGTIASFNAQNGMLTITLTNGQSVTGQVTPATRIECENENEIENENEVERHGGDVARAADHGGGDDSGGDHGGGDNSGPGSGGSNTSPSTTTPTQPSNSGPGSSNSGPGSANSGPGNAEQGQQPPAQPGQPGQPGDRNDENCGTAGLVPGTPVREAEARLTGNGLVFEEIELGQAPQQAPAPMPHQ